MLKGLTEVEHTFDPAIEVFKSFAKLFQKFTIRTFIKLCTIGWRLGNLPFRECGSYRKHKPQLSEIINSVRRRVRFEYVETTPSTFIHGRKFAPFFIFLVAPDCMQFII